MHGKPKYLRADNGREFIGEDLQLWLKEQDVTPIFIEKASPTQNCYIERFNGSMRRELLNGELFHSVLEAKVVIEEWLELYNTRRPAPRARWQDPRCVRQDVQSQLTMTPVVEVRESAYHH